MHLNKYFMIAVLLFIISFVSGTSAYAQSGCIQISSVVLEFGPELSMKNNCNQVLNVVIANPTGSQSINYLQPGQNVLLALDPKPSLPYRYWQCTPPSVPEVQVNMGLWEAPRYTSTGVICSGPRQIHKIPDPHKTESFNADERIDYFIGNARF